MMKIVRLNYKKVLSNQNRITLDLPNARFIKSYVEKNILFFFSVFKIYPYTYTMLKQIGTHTSLIFVKM
jgi:hypothetical protein